MHDFVAHKEGVNGLSWGPPTEPALLSSSSDDLLSQKASGKFQPPVKRLVSGGNDMKVQLWELPEGQEEPKGQEIGVHGDWVRDVAWCNNIGLQHEMIASCSEDKTARVWKKNGEKGSWTFKEIKLEEDVPLWKVSWSHVGNMLAISGGDNQVHVMSEDHSGNWEAVQVVNEQSIHEASQ